MIRLAISALYSALLLAYVPLSHTCNPRNPGVVDPIGPGPATPNLAGKSETVARDPDRPIRPKQGPKKQFYPDPKRPAQLPDISPRRNKALLPEIQPIRDKQSSTPSSKELGQRKATARRRQGAVVIKKGRHVRLITPDTLGGTARIDAVIKDTGNSGPISSARDLDCLDWSVGCRWRNEPSNLYDKLQWARGTGDWAPERGQLAFGTQHQPSAPWAITGSERRLSPNDNAMLVSDTVTCQQGDGELSFLYWATQGSSIRVCTREPNGGVNYLYCSPDINQGAPGPAVVNLPGPIRRPFELVVEARGFTFEQFGREGGAVVIDDLRYQAAQVSNCVRREDVKTTTEPPNNQNDDAEACSATACDFDGACASRLISNGRGWKTGSGPVGNRHTGVRGGLAGSYAYAQGPSPSVQMTTTPFALQSDRILRFCYYRPSALSNLEVVAIRNGRREKVFATQELTSRSPQHTWLCDDSLLLPRGSYEGIEFSAKGLQTQYSFLGLDNLQLFDVNNPDAPLCF